MKEDDSSAKPGSDFAQRLKSALWGDSALVKILVFVCLGLMAVFVAGTAAALALGLPQRRAASLAGAAQAPADPGYANFQGVGPLRVRSADKKPALVSLTVVLSVPAADSAFREELISKTQALKDVCRGYFASKKADALRPGFEGALKAELRDLLNAKLSLGRIREVYFPDYQLID